MEQNHIVSNLEIELNTNTASEQDPKSDIYEVMHMDRLVASVSSSGAVKIVNRKYAKETFNSIGAAQAVTDRERAYISLSYHCVSLTDVFWVRKQGEEITFRKINLYDKTLNKAVVEISLRGRQMTVTNRELAQDLSTKGCFPKAWIREYLGGAGVEGQGNWSAGRKTSPDL